MALALRAFERSAKKLIGRSNSFLALLPVTVFGLFDLAHSNQLQLFQRSFINMIRALRTSSIAVLGVSLFLLGCSNSVTSRSNDAPIKVTEGVDKRGNKTKAMDASFEDPNYKKK
jgi:hypothetical protein